MDLVHRRPTLDSTVVVCFWWRHELRQLWYMRVPPLGSLCFSSGYSSAPEWLEPVLWPRTWSCELMCEQQQQQQRVQYSLRLLSGFPSLRCLDTKYKLLIGIAVAAFGSFNKIILRRLEWGWCYMYVRIFLHWWLGVFPSLGWLDNAS